MSESTGPMTLEQAAESLLAPEPASETETKEIEKPDEVEDAETEDEAEQPEEDSDADADSEEDGEDEDETDEAEDEPESLYTVTVDGVTKRVSLDELKRGYSGQEFIQKGMKVNADAKKYIMEQAQSLDRQRAQIEQLVAATQDGGFIPPTPPDDALIETDPIGYMEQRAKYEKGVATFQRNLQALNEQRQLGEAQRQAQHRDYLMAQAEELKRIIPDFADPKKAEAIKGQLRKVALDYGFTEEDVDSVSDAKTLQVLNDARKWRELQASKKAAEKKVEGARPVVKPGAKRQPESRKKAREKQRARLKQSGRIEDAVALLFDS